MDKVGHERNGLKFDAGVPWPRRTGSIVALAGSAVGSAGSWTIRNRISIALVAAALIVTEGGLALLGARTPFAPICALAFASCLSSVAGFAFSPIAQILLAPFSSDSVQNVQTTLVCSIATQSLAILSLRQGMEWRHLPAFLAGGVPGLPIGIFLLLHLPTVDFRIAIGLTILAYGLIVLIRRPIVLPPTGPWADVAIGFVGGITGGLAAFPGAAITIWCGMKGWDKMRQRGVYQPFILAMQLLALPTLVLMRGSANMPHSRTSASLVDAMAFVPVALVGTWLGLHAFRRISDRRFEQCMAGMLAFAGAMMVL